MKELILTQGMVALVDDEDFDKLSKYKWTSKIHKDGLSYAKRGTSKGGYQKTFSMHREILGINDPSIEVDHIDGNGLNNQRYNLRKCTSSQNKMNCKKRVNTSSRFKGVYWDISKRSWISRIKIENKCLFIGGYKNEKEAALAYNVAASFAFREFANINKF